MPFSTITSKGQITIPKSVRKSLGLQPGDRIEFFVHENGEIIVKPIAKKVDEVFGRLYDNKRKPVSVDEMDEAVRQRFKKEQ